MEEQDYTGLGSLAREMDVQEEEDKKHSHLQVILDRLSRQYITAGIKRHGKTIFKNATQYSAYKEVKNARFEREKARRKIAAKSRARNRQ